MMARQVGVLWLKQKKMEFENNFSAIFSVDGPRNATMRAIVQGVNEGRRGLGNIYVWASGDGGEEDDCNCDGYAASMWTISINSAINDGQNAHYDESCSSTLASTFSNGAKDPNTGVVS